MNSKWNSQPVTGQSSKKSVLFGASCETPATAGARTRWPTDTPKVHVELPALQKPSKKTNRIPREDTQSGENMWNFWWEAKKRDILCFHPSEPPHFHVGPHFHFSFFCVIHFHVFWFSSMFSCFVYLAFVSFFDISCFPCSAHYLFSYLLHFAIFPFFFIFRFVFQKMFFLSCHFGGCKLTHQNFVSSLEKSEGLNPTSQLVSAPACREN